MRFRSTIILFLAVAGLLAYILIREREQPTTDQLAARENAVVTFQLENISYIEIANAGETIQLSRSDINQPWTMKRPLKGDLADPRLINDILHALLDLRAIRQLHKTELPSGELDLKEFGLKNSRQTIDLRGDGPPRVILFGDESVGAGGIYLFRKGSGAVSLVPPNIRKLIFRPAADFRDPRLTTLPPQKFTSLHISRPDAPDLHLELQDGFWRLTQPYSALADSQKTYEAINKLLNLTITGTASENTETPAPFGLAPPAGTITLTAATQPGLTAPYTFALTLGSAAPAPQNQNIHATLTGRPFTYLLPKEAADLLSATPESLRNRRLVHQPIDRITSIRIQPAGQPEIHLQKDTADPIGLWREIPPAPADKPLPVQQSEVVRLVKELNSAEIAAFPASNIPETDFPLYGLATPALTLLFDGEKITTGYHKDPGQPGLKDPESVPVTATLAIGNPSPEGLLHTRIDREPHITDIPPAFIRSIYTASWQWRPLALLAADPADILSVEIARPSGDAPPLKFTRPAPAAPWTPEPPPQLDAVLRALAKLRALRWLAPAPLPEHNLAPPAPALTITITLRDHPAPITLTLGPTPTLDGDWPATTTASPAVAALSRPDHDLLTTLRP